MASYIRKESVKNSNEGILDVDVQDLMGRFTLSTIASVAFGFDIDALTSEESHFKKMAAQFTGFSLGRVVQMVTCLIVPKLAKLLGFTFTDEESLKFFEQVVQENIKQRRENKEGSTTREDFLQLMLEAQAGQLASTATSLEEREMTAYEKDAILNDSGSVKNPNVILDDTTILAQSALFFVAGADTLESALTFVFYALALNPEVQEKLADEVVREMEESQGNLSYEAVNQMQYLEMVLTESLRLFPPVAVTERQCTKDYTLPDTNIIITKGTLVKIPIAGIHYDEKHYDNPMTFNPENFSAENKAKRQPFTFLPFGQGPRNCIAMRFAMTEAKAAIAHIVYNFKIEPSEKTQTPVKYNPRASVLKPEDGLWLKFKPRGRRIKKDV